MFSFGWGEILLILLVVIIVVGPKDIPKFLRQIGNLSKSIKKISREFKSSLNQIAEETDLKDVKNSITEITDLNKDLDIKSNLKNEIKTIKETISSVEEDVSNINKSKSPSIPHACINSKFFIIFFCLCSSNSLRVSSS